MKKIHIRKTIYWSLITLSIITMIFSLYKLNLKYTEEAKTKDKLKEILVVFHDIQNETKQIRNAREMIEIYRGKYKNEDVVGILKVGEIIDTALVQTTNNDYYLKHLITKEESKAGAVFVDYRTKLNVNKQINIYGHNSGVYEVPFHQLEKYIDNKNYEENKDITLITEEGINTYEIFSVNIVKNDIEHMKTDYQTKLEWEDHFNKLKKEGSLYETNIDVTGDDEIIVLQTCLFNNSKGKLLIINARKVKD